MTIRERAEVLIQALPYIQKYNGKIVVIKYGGNAMKPRIQAVHISKRFPGVLALSDISIDFYPGEVHALLGENGAGKSTLIKILSGVYTPTEGEVILDGEKVDFVSPRQALDAGIAVIHQELSIANDLTVAENIFLGMLTVTCSCQRVGSSSSVACQAAASLITYALVY